VAPLLLTVLLITFVVRVVVAGARERCMHRHTFHGSLRCNASASSP